MSVRASKLRQSIAGETTNRCIHISAYTSIILIMSADIVIIMLKMKYYQDNVLHEFGVEGGGPWGEFTYYRKCCLAVCIAIEPSCTAVPLLTGRLVAMPTLRMQHILTGSKFH